MKVYFSCSMLNFTKTCSCSCPCTCSCSCPCTCTLMSRGSYIPVTQSLFSRLGSPIFGLVVHLDYPEARCLELVDHRVGLDVEHLDGVHELVSIDVRDCGHDAPSSVFRPQVTGGRAGSARSLPNLHLTCGTWCSPW